MSTIYLWTILAYMLALAVVGVRSRRKVESQEDFSVAGRELSAFVLFGTLLAAWVGAGSIFGNAEKTYRVGIAALILPLASVCGMAVLYRIAARVRGLKQITAQDLLEKRYNATARPFGALTLIIAYNHHRVVSIPSSRCGAEPGALPASGPGRRFVERGLYHHLHGGGGHVLHRLHRSGARRHHDRRDCRGLAPVLGPGGRTGGNAGPTAGFTLELFGPISFTEALGLLLPAFLLILGDANMYQRVFSARSQGTARQAARWTIAGVAFMESMIILTAWVASSLEPGLEIDGRVIIYAARDYLPPFLGALVLTATMAIILSAASSYLLSPATCVVRDIYQRFLKPEAPASSLVFLLRASVVALGVTAYYLSTLSDEFLSVALLAYTIYGAGITPAPLAAFFWKRATSAGAVASIGLGAVTTLAWKAAGIVVVDAVVPAIVASITSLALVSLVTPPPAKEKVDPFFPSGS